MKRREKTIAILLVCSFILALCSGCGSSGTESTQSDASAQVETPAEASSDNSTETAEETAEVEAVTTTDTDSADEMDDASDDAIVEEVEEETTPAVSISYPISDGSVTFTTWVSEDPEFMSLFDDYDSACVTLSYAEEATGVNLSTTTVSILSAQEQYNLMYASGEWPDFMSVGFYTGGIEQAYNDEVIIELTEEMLDTYMPDYQAYKKAQNKVTQDAITSNGMNLGIYALTDAIYQDRGIVIRGDWLDELGFDVPTTLDELTEILYAFHNTYGSSHTYDVNGGGVLRYLYDAFDTYVLDTSGSDPNIFVRDGVVCTPLTDDNYRAYIEWFVELYKDGVINKDFVNDGNTSTNTLYGLVASGECAFWEARAEIIENVNDYMDSPISVIPMQNITDDGVNNWGDEEVYTEDDFGSTSITTTCENKELLMEFLNYFFTDEGIELANYGVEGITFTIDEDGQYAFTELVTDSDLVFSSALTTYCVSKAVPYWSYQDRKWMYSSDAIKNAITTWSSLETTSDRVYPEGAGLNSDEVSEVTVVITDIMTYANSQLLKFLTAAEELTDEAWDSYLAQLETMGLSDVLAVYQNAYDEYQAGLR